MSMYFQEVQSRKTIWMLNCFQKSLKREYQLALIQRAELPWERASGLRQFASCLKRLAYSWPTETSSFSPLMRQICNVLQLTVRLSTNGLVHWSKWPGQKTCDWLLNICIILPIGLPPKGY